MLNRLPSEIIGVIASLLHGTDIRSMWFSGDSLLRVKLRAGIFVLILPFSSCRQESIVWPSNFIKQLPQLSQVIFNIGYYNDVAEIRGLDLTVLPKTLKRLDLRSRTSSTTFPAPISQLFPELERLDICDSHEAAGAYPPWPALLRRLRVICYLEGVPAHLNELPSTLEHLELAGILKFRRSETINWPNLTYLSLNVDTNSFSFLHGLPMTLTTLCLSADPLPDTNSMSTLFWDLIPSSLTQLNVYTTATSIELIPRPNPEQLKRMTRLRDLLLDINYSESEVSDDGLEADLPDGVMAFWKACPSLTNLYMTNLCTKVSDGNIKYLPENYRKVVTVSNLAGEKNSQRRPTRPVFSASSLSLLPSGTHTLVIECLISSDTLAGIILPSQIRYLTWNARVKQPIQIYPSFLHQQLQIARLQTHYLSHPTLVVPNHFQWLPSSLERLEINTSFFPPVKGANFFHSRLFDLSLHHSELSNSSPYPHMWEHLDPLTLPKSLVSFTLILQVQPPVLSKSFLDWLDKILFEHMPNLNSLVINFGYSVNLSDLSFETPGLNKRKIGKAILRRIANSKIQTLGIMVQNFRPRFLKRLPSGLTSLSIYTMDNSMERLTPEYLQHFPRSLVAITFNGLSMPTIDMQDWMSAGLPKPKYLLHKSHRSVSKQK